MKKFNIHFLGLGLCLEIYVAHSVLTWQKHRQPITCSVGHNNLLETPRIHMFENLREPLSFLTHALNQ